MPKRLAEQKGDGKGNKNARKGKIWVIHVSCDFVLGLQVNFALWSRSESWRGDC
jgi:hypothetical protein